MVGRRSSWLIGVGTLLAVLAVGSGASAAAAEPAPFAHACKAQDGVRFCPTETLPSGCRPSTGCRSTST